MTLPTGSIDMAQVNIELGLSLNTNISLNQVNVRTLAGKSSGQISMNDLRGKSSAPTFNYAPGNYNLSDSGVINVEITSDKSCVWTYTRSGTGANTPATSGATSTRFAMRVSATTGSKYCQWNLTATYNGVSYNWVMYLVATA